MGNELDIKLRAVIKAALPADMGRSKKVAVAALLRKIAAEYDGTAPAKATKKKYEAAGDAAVGNKEEFADVQRLAVRSSLRSSLNVGDDDSEADAAVLLGGAGGKNAYRAEGSPLGFCMADPTSNQRMAWDFCVIMPLLAYLTLSMPFRMCFGNEAVGTMMLVETCMDLLFIFDIFVNFRTAYTDDVTGELVTDSADVFWHYLKGWFPLDLVSGIPFGLLDQPELSKLSALKVLKGSRVLKAVKLLRFLKLSRLIKGSKILSSLDAEVIDRVEDFLQNGNTKTVLRMLRIVTVMGFLCHFMCCFWVLAGRTSDKNGERSWLNHFDPEHAYFAEDTESGPHVGDLYVAAYYFCFTTMTTVGYGDIFPYSNGERIMCIFLQICGGFVMAWVIASLTSIVTSVDANSSFASARMEGVASYVSKMQVPEDLGRRIRRHFRHFFENKSSLDESTIMMEMSTALRQELTEFLVQGGPMSEVALFKSLSSVYWARVLPLLRPCMFARLETVCRQGEDCVEGYIVTEGCLTGATMQEASSTEYGRDKLTSHRPGHRLPHAQRPSLLSGQSFMARQEVAMLGSATQLMVHGGKAIEFEPEAARRVQAYHARVVQLRNLEVALDDDQVQRSASRVARQSQETAATLDAEYMLDVDARLHLRVLVSGGVVNTLAVVKVWDRCVETVQATEKTDCYALSADLFHDEFKEDADVWRKMQEHMVETQFKMDTHSEAALDARSDPENYKHSEWGVPLYMYAETEQEQHEAEYLKKQYKQRKIAARAKIRALRGPAAQ